MNEITFDVIEKVLFRAKQLIQPDTPLTGKELFQLYQTHGVSPDVVELIQNRVLPSELWNEFERERGISAAASRANQKPRAVLIAK